VVLRGLRQAFPKDRWPKNLLVIGAGAIGLLVVRALRLLGYSGPIHQVARHPHQVALAKEMGASQVHGSAWEAARSVGATSYKAIIGPPAWRGGFDATVEAAGSRSSLEEACWTVAEGGTVLLLGAIGEVRHDVSPLWSRDLRVVGSYSYNHEEFGQAVTLLEEAEGLERLVGASYRLESWQQALAAVRARQAARVAFAPQS
jgi:threonine dehydrogenase-like Zn-dependent dehydrogenase